ncbi:MAG TPA: PAS and ANTAR domain-containing protein [Nocardioidaceae bacterium]|nr:PAS and ANTAR domain-containing protein [Nocardioidaceae bacterium]
MSGSPSVIPSPAGPFRYRVVPDSWWWSDTLFRIHGFEPGQVVPTTELLLSHKHPEDEPVVRETVRRVLADGRPFALWHRILDADGRVRQVVSTGAGELRGGRVVEVHGHMVDVTDAHRLWTSREVAEAVQRSAESRAVIEQAKGVLMAVLGVDEDEAFELLRRSSQHQNVKVRDLARTMMCELRRVRGDNLAARIRDLLERAPSA